MLAKNEPRRFVVLVMASIILILGCLCTAIYGSLYYVTVPFPAPKPYPGSQVKQGERAIGAGRRSIEFEYTVDHSLNELQDYYEGEMKQYCEDGWTFTETESACRDYLNCKVAQCVIPRPFVEDAQFFLIYLRSMSESQTNVLYIQITYDP